MATESWRDFWEKMRKVEKILTTLGREKISDSFVLRTYPLKIEDKDEYDPKDTCPRPAMGVSEIRGTGDAISLLNTEIGLPKTPIIGSPDHVYEVISSAIIAIQEMRM